MRVGAASVSDSMSQSISGGPDGGLQAWDRYGIWLGLCGLRWLKLVVHVGCWLGLWFNGGLGLCCWVLARRFFFSYGTLQIGKIRQRDGCWRWYGLWEDGVDGVFLDNSHCEGGSAHPQDKVEGTSRIWTKMYLRASSSKHVSWYRSKIYSAYSNVWPFCEGQSLVFFRSVVFYSSLRVGYSVTLCMVQSKTLDASTIILSL